MGGRGVYRKADRNQQPEAWNRTDRGQFPTAYDSCGIQEMCDLDSRLQRDNRLVLSQVTIA